MKRTIAIVCGGDTSEFQVSLRSAQGIYSFIDKEKYTLYIVEMHGLDWHVQLRVKTDVCKVISTFFISLIPVVVCWQLHLLTISLRATNISKYSVCALQSL